MQKSPSKISKGFVSKESVSDSESISESAEASPSYVKEAELSAPRVDEGGLVIKAIAMKPDHTTVNNLNEINKFLSQRMKSHS